LIPIHSIPFLPFPSLVLSAWVYLLGLSLGFISWVYLLGLSLGACRLAITRVAFQLVPAGFDAWAESFFQKVSALGIAGIPCGCRAFVHGKKKMKIYFHLFGEKL
jgi:hypothetical protein